MSNPEKSCLCFSKTKPTPPKNKTAIPERLNIFPQSDKDDIYDVRLNPDRESYQITKESSVLKSMSGDVKTGPSKTENYEPLIKKENSKERVNSPAHSSQLAMKFSTLIRESIEKQNVPKMKFRWKNDDSMTFIVRAKLNLSNIWCELPEVLATDAKASLENDDEYRLQEGLQEVVGSEATYLNNLDILITHFMNSYVFTPLNDNLGGVNPVDKHKIFGNIIDIFGASQNFLDDLQERWDRDAPYWNNIFDIVNKHAIGIGFKGYVIYLRNSYYRNYTLRKVFATQIQLKEIRKLEQYQACKGLTLESYLLLPLQRITRLKLLCSACLKLYERTNNTRVYRTAMKDCNSAIDNLDKLIRLSENCKVELDNQMLLSDLINKLDYPSCCRMLHLQNKMLILEKEVYAIPPLDLIANRATTRYIRYVFLLFLDILLIAKRNGSRLKVVDYCPRKNVQLTAQFSDKNKMNLTLPSNVIREVRQSSCFIFRMENSTCSAFLDPVIAKVEREEDLNDLLTYIPDFLEPEKFDFQRNRNKMYWNNEIYA